MPEARYVWLVMGYDGHEHYPVMVFDREDEAVELAAKIGGSADRILFVAVLDE